jgi:predicted ATP-dependent serine protease
MKQSTDANDILQSHGEDALRARSDRAQKYRRPMDGAFRPAKGIDMSADELCAKIFPPVKYVVPGYIVEGLTLLAGKPKAGKSWLVLHAALAVARNGFTLGDVCCPQGDVLYCALEDTWRRLQRRLRKLLGGEPAPKSLTLRVDLPRLAEGGLDAIRAWIERADNPRLIVVDVLAKVRDHSQRNDQGHYAADYAAMQGLKELADRYGIAIVVVHHLRKMDAEDPLDQISGTTGLAGSADTVLVLHKSGTGVTLKGRGRDIEEIDKAVLFNKNACTWTVVGEANEVEQATVQGSILSILHEAKAPLSPQEVTDLCANATLANVRKSLARMEKNRKVIKVRYGQYIHPDRDDLNPSMRERSL